jgi:hypothetical protein
MIAARFSASMKMASLWLLCAAGVACDDQSAGPGAGAVDAVHRSEAAAPGEGDAARRPMTISDLPPALAQGADPVLLRLEPSRGGCVLSYARGGGEESIYGGAELCPGGASDLSPMIGAPVRLAVGKGQWALCQDGSACADRPEIDVAVGVQAL